MRLCFVCCFSPCCLLLCCHVATLLCISRAVGIMYTITHWCATGRMKSGALVTNGCLGCLLLKILKLEIYHCFFRWSWHPQISQGERVFLSHLRRELCEFPSRRGLDTMCEMLSLEPCSLCGFLKYYFICLRLL